MRKGVKSRRMSVIVVDEDDESSSSNDVEDKEREGARNNWLRRLGIDAFGRNKNNGGNTNNDSGSDDEKRSAIQLQRNNSKEFRRASTPHVSRDFDPRKVTSNLRCA